MAAPTVEGSKTMQYDGFYQYLSSGQSRRLAAYNVFLIYCASIPTQVIMFFLIFGNVVDKHYPLFFDPMAVIAWSIFLWPVVGPLLFFLLFLIVRTVVFFGDVVSGDLLPLPDPRWRKYIHDMWIGNMWLNLIEPLREQFGAVYEPAYPKIQLPIDSLLVSIRDFIDSAPPFVRAILFAIPWQFGWIGLTFVGALVLLPLEFVIARHLGIDGAAWEVFLYGLSLSLGPAVGAVVVYLILVYSQRDEDHLLVPFESRPSEWSKLATLLRQPRVAPTFRLGKEILFPVMQRTGHTHVLGMTRMGKSKALESWIMQDIEAGRGVGVIDPHGSLIENLLKRLVDVPDIARRLILVDPVDPEFVVGLNPLDRLPGATFQTHADVLADIFAVIWADMWPDATWLQECTYHGGWVMSETGWTMLEIPRFYNNKDFQACIMDRVKSVFLKEWWFERFKKLSWGQQQHHTESLQTRITMFGRNQHLRPMIGKRKATLDFQEVLESGDKVLLVNLRSTDLRGGAYELLGAVIMTLIQLAALRRGDIGDDDQRRFHLYVDEFHSFANEAFAELLSEIAKFGLSLTLANQHLEQLDRVRGLRAAVLGNCLNKISFRLGYPEDAEVMADQLFTLTSKMPKDQRRRWRTIGRLPVPETDTDYYRLSEERQIYKNILMGKGKDGLAKRDFVYLGESHLGRDTTVFVPDGSATDNQVRDMIRQSVEHQEYARPRDEVEQELAQRPVLIQQFIENCNEDDDEPVLREQA